jgi:tetrahydromethanopterin S-methyltransferase subunit F
LSQREAAGVPYDAEHGKLWQDIKADLDKTRTRASILAANAEWAFGKKTARVLGVLALFAVAVILLFVFLDLYVAPTKPSGKKDLVLAVAQILAGAALLSGLYFTWRTLQVNREGQITERFAKAIELLGATNDGGGKNLEQRLGAIHILGQIAGESEHRAKSVMDILTTYVRQNSPRNLAQDKSEESPSEDISPELDIETILNTIGYAEVSRIREAQNIAVNLWSTDLRRADLYSAKLTRTYLRDADLRDAELTDIDLTNANLTNANLTDAALEEVRGLTQRQIERTIGNEETPLPEGLTRPTTWTQVVESPHDKMPENE